MAVRADRPSNADSGALLMACLLCCACDSAPVVLQSNVSEREAARSLTTLAAHHIGAERQPHQHSPGAAPSFDLRVASADVATACRVLDTPLVHDDAAAMTSAFIPTPFEERARARTTTALELERTIALWDGVTEVKVQITEATSAVALGEAKAPSRVAATVVHLPGQAPNVRAIEQLVRHVVGNADDARVLVSLIERHAVAKRPLTQVGPITVTAGSAPLLRTLLVTLLALTTILAILLLWNVRKARLRRD